MTAGPAAYPVGRDETAQRLHVLYERKLRRLAGQYPDNETGRRLGVSARTVLRHRARQGLPPYQPAGPSESPSR